MSYTAIQIQQGRNIIGAYKVSHSNLYAINRERKGIPIEHTALLETMEKALRQVGFKDGDGLQTFRVWDEFNTASELQNVQELGFIDFDDFEKRAEAKDERLLEEKWHG